MEEPSDYTAAMFSQQVSWYKVDLDETALGPDMVKLLSGYSGVSEPEQPAHIKSIVSASTPHPKQLAPLCTQLLLCLVV